MGSASATLAQDSSAQNLPPAHTHPAVVDQALEKEIRAGRIAGPFNIPPPPPSQTSAARPWPDSQGHQLVPDADPEPTAIPAQLLFHCLADESTCRRRLSLHPLREPTQLGSATSSNSAVSTTYPFPPASVLTIRFFGAEQSAFASHGTITAYVLAIRMLHLEKGCGDPTTNAPLLALLLQGIKDPLTPHGAQGSLSQLRCSSTSNSPSGALKTTPLIASSIGQL